MNILEMARKAELNKELWLTNECLQRLERFAQLVAEHEREMCAKVCERGEYAIDGGGNAYYRPADARWCVEAIRTRGQS